MTPFRSLSPKGFPGPGKAPLCTRRHRNRGACPPAGPAGTAIAKYPAVASGTKTSGYLATGTFTGEAVKQTAGKNTYTIVYEGEQIVVPFNFAPLIQTTSDVDAVVGEPPDDKDLLVVQRFDKPLVKYQPHPAIPLSPNTQRWPPGPRPPAILPPAPLPVRR